MKLRIIVTALVLLTGCVKDEIKVVYSDNAPDPTTNLETCDVVPGSVHDGDTIRVNCQGRQLKIRFACIDAPELTQPMGTQSKDYLRSLLADNSNKIKVNPITTDKYGRTVAELWGNNGLIQSLMVGKGMAYPYEKYKNDCINWQAVSSAGDFAKENHLGVWASNLEKPWDYRKKK